MLQKIQPKDYEFFKQLLPQLTLIQFESLMKGNFGYLLCEKQSKPLGILTFSILWEKFPFVQHLIIISEKRNQGYGTKALIEFEKQMKEDGYKMMLLSTQADEKAQFLYRKLGYIDCGGLILENTPYDQPIEIFFKKNLI